MARQIQPSAVRTQEMSAPHFRSGPSAVKSCGTRFGATCQACSLSVVRLKRRFCRAVSWFSRISRAVRCRPIAWPPSTRSRCMRGSPWVPSDNARRVRICAEWTMSCRWRRQVGRSCQAKKPLWLTPRTRHIRLIGKLAFSASMKPKAIRGGFSRTDGIHPPHPAFAKKAAAFLEVSRFCLRTALLGRSLFSSA